ATEAWMDVTQHILASRDATQTRTASSTTPVPQPQGKACCE
ncbi:MAG TPA: PadR family transcriptional regulator, partial [Thalassospira sp.]|nr:PadR family transcriptional regulator [Thalassospira sp.]